MTEKGRRVRPERLVTAPSGGAVRVMAGNPEPRRDAQLQSPALRAESAPCVGASEGTAGPGAEAGVQPAGEGITAAGEVSASSAACQPNVAHLIRAGKACTPANAAKSLMSSGASPEVTM